MSLGLVLLLAAIESTGLQGGAMCLEVRSNAQTIDSPRPLYTRVRSDNEYLIGLIRRGYDQSPAFRELVDALQYSNVIVFVQPGLCAGARIRSCLVAVAGSNHDRHIRIRVDPAHTIENGLIAAIAHELQHAIEVAERPDVLDSASLAALYRRIAIGRCGQGLSNECETTRALTTERTVYLELQRGETRPSARKVRPRAAPR
jgi:hypothetical protein